MSRWLAWGLAWAVLFEAFLFGGFGDLTTRVLAAIMLIGDCPLSPRGRP